MNDNLPLEVQKVLKFPRPGDLVVAKVPMKSRRLALDGAWAHWPSPAELDKGRVGLVVQSFMFGTQFRMVVLVDGELMRFAQKPHCVALNWERHIPLDGA